jgi:hypothetical protein
MLSTRKRSRAPLRWSAARWAGVRAEFEGGKPIAAIARDRRISRETLHKRIRAEGWRVVQGPLPEAAPAPVARAPDPSDPPIIAEGRALILRMLDELDAVTSYQGQLAEEIAVETAGDRDPRRRAAMLRAIDLSSRSTILKNLATATKTFAEVHGPGALGKKERAVEAAKSAGRGTDWGDDLTPSTKFN